MRGDIVKKFLEEYYLFKYGFFQSYVYNLVGFLGENQNYKCGKRVVDYY